MERNELIKLDLTAGTNEPPLDAGLASSRETLSFRIVSITARVADRLVMEAVRTYQLESSRFSTLLPEHARGGAELGVAPSRGPLLLLELEGFGVGTASRLKASYRKMAIYLNDGWAGVSKAVNARPNSRIDLQCHSGY